MKIKCIVVYMYFYFLFIITEVNGKWSSMSGLYSNICQEKELGKISNDNVIRVFNPETISEDNDTPFKNRELIVSSFEKQTVIWAVNFLESLFKLTRPLEKSGLSVDHIEVLFIVYDEETLKMCDKISLPCWYPLDMFSRPPPALESKGRRKKRNENDAMNSPDGVVTNPFQLRAALRLQAVSRLVEGGANVLLSETDVYWLRTPYAYFSKENTNVVVS